MMEIEKLKLLPQSHLDVERYDRVVESAPNSRVYAISWYLDHVIDSWDVLVYGDYEYVMPLPWKRRLGIRYAVQPPYTQQLGIFPSPPHEIMNLFISAIGRHFRFAKVQFNSDNTSPFEGLVPRQNLLLNLHFPYNGLYAEYSGHTRRHLKRAAENHFTFSEGLMAADYIDFKRSAQPARKLTSQLGVLQRLMGFLLFKGQGFLYGVYNRENQLCAAALFVLHGRRLIYLNGVSLREAHSEGAMYYLMDRVVQQFAHRQLSLDFEGSMLPGVARFFEGFGGRSELYFAYTFNRLPIPLRWLL